jgi:uncharacterized protein involved in exopolysaccharide biosynthesis
MDKFPPESTEHTRSDDRMRDRVVYVMPQEALLAASDELTLLDVWNVLWRGKWPIIGITTVFAVLSLAYALSATHWYESNVLLAPAEERSAPALAGALGGLASLAGVSIGGGDSAAEALAVLASRNFTMDFIEDNDLLPVLFADRWDESTGTWFAGDSAEAPDIRDAVKFFDEDIRTVSRDRETGFVTLAIEWTDPELAASWANLLVERLNGRMRQRALAEAEANVGYLQTEFASTSVVTLQQSISRLLETEMQKLMLARGSEEFAFRVIDRALVPKSRSRPARALIVVLSTFVGGMLAVCLVFLLNALKSARATGT